MERVNYIIAAWSGPRRDGGSGLACLKKQLNQLSVLKHSIAQVTIVVPDNPGEPSDFRGYVENRVALVEETGGIPVTVLRRPNIGLSYGSWSYAYEETRMLFDYYIFMEDDYYFVEDNFDEKLIRMASWSNAYVCGFVSKRGTTWWPGNSNGICSVGNLEKVYRKHGGLPFDNNARDGNYTEESGQIAWGEKFTEAGVQLDDITREYACLHWYWQHKQCQLIPGQMYAARRYLFVPYQARLGHNFLPYKDVHRGAEGVLIATGPTFKRYDHHEIKKKGRIIVAVNSAIMDLTRDPHYYFFGHVDKRSEEYLFKVKDLACAKFGFTRVNALPQETCLSDTMARHLGATPYELDTSVGFEQHLEVFPLVDHAINFSALQFMIWTGIRKIFLVGCDVTAVVSHRDPSIDEDRQVEKMMAVWRDFKEYAERMGVEVVVINPVGLKGMFQERVC